jgi:hypothetical protein
MNNDVEQYVHQLINPATRENALLELSKKRENFPELAPFLWYSFGTIAALLQEIVSIYPLLSPPALTAHASNRVCNALALLQCVASHTDTRAMFLQGERGWPVCNWHIVSSAALANPSFSSPACSPHPSLPVPIPQHIKQDKAL